MKLPSLSNSSAAAASLSEVVKTSDQLLLQGGKDVLKEALAPYHPVVIEGMGMYDPRDPAVVANHIHSQLRSHWQKHKDRLNPAPTDSAFRPLVVVQGDPLRERGISAITPLVAEYLQAPRALVCLDESIADYHSPSADRDNVVVEFRYSDLVQVLEEDTPGSMSRLESKIDEYLKGKNQRRKEMDKPPLKGYFRNFALLQEVTKAACLTLCGDVTVIHTQKVISDFSVTSFYEAGLEMGYWLESNLHMVSYDLEDDLDFDKIDKR